MPSECSSGSSGRGCARRWNVQTQSFTSAAQILPQGPVTVKVLSRLASGKDRSKPFKAPRPATLGQGEPVELYRTSEYYVFNVSAAGQYSVELFGQDDLTNALLIFLDDEDSVRAQSTRPKGGRQYRFTRPGVHNPSNPSWTPTSTGAPTVLCLRRPQAFCRRRGLWGEEERSSEATSHPKPLRRHAARIQGPDHWRGGVGKTPVDDRRALVQLCGNGVAVEDLITVNALLNIELNPYWAPGMTPPPPPVPRS